RRVARTDQARWHPWCTQRSGVAIRAGGGRRDRRARRGLGPDRRRGRRRPRRCTVARRTTAIRRRAAEIRSDLPDRIAVAESAAPEPAGGVADPVAVRAAVESDREIRRLRERATSRMPDLVERALAVIWDVA